MSRPVGKLLDVYTTDNETYLILYGKEEEGDTVAKCPKELAPVLSKIAEAINKLWDMNGRGLNGRTF